MDDNTNQGTSQQTGTDKTEQTFTQADVDRFRRESADTREKNVRAQLQAEFEKKQLESKQEFQKLWEQEKAEKQALLDSQKRADFIIENGLSAFKKFFSNVPISELENVKSELAAALTAQTQAEIKKTLKTTEPPVSGDPTKPKKLGDMTNDEYAAYRKQKFGK